MTGRTRLSEEDANRKLGEISDILRATLRNLFVDREKTNCPQLWDVAFVDQYGNVFNCCHSRPGALGKLQDSHLSAIWQHSRRLKLFRWLSRHRALYCALNCTLISAEDRASPPPKLPSPGHPTTVRILHGELCNLACIMCWQDHRDRQIISNRLLTEQIEWSEVEHVELQGGEVLAMKEAKEFFIWLTQEMGKKADLITNGTLIDETWARNLVLGANWVAISVNAASKEVHERVNRGSRFEKVAENIRRMTRLKQQLGADMQIIYKFSIIPDNIHEIPDAIPVAADLGCDKVAYGFDPTTVPAYLQQNPELQASLRRRLKEQLTAGYPIEIEKIRLQHLGLLNETGVES
jgi:MoaA/NifB/PqqE/SkfB family radical SAM enzyme